ncbi:MAG: hypothetical protein ACLP22_14845 [Solirubrobacteraceae bacterium]
MHQWWRVHRENQHTDEPATPNTHTDQDAVIHAHERPLVETLAALYSYAYQVPAADVRVAAEQRALAMRYSDRWVRQGRKQHSPLIDLERTALVRSYAGLLASVHR